MTSDGPVPSGTGSEPEELAALRAAFEEQSRLLRELTEEVRSLRESVGRAPDTGGDDVWQRLGLAAGERRRVTVIFADVSGFTAMAETMDAEQVREVMQGTLGEISEIIRSHDGHIEKFIGDAVCAVFGAPIAHEDEPQRAVKSALEIHEAMERRATGDGPGRDLSVHIGINTGLVVAGGVGDGSQFGVMGDTINTAARLMDLAESGQTFVSSETARRVRRQFLIEDMGGFELKGKRHPVEVFNVERELSEDEAVEARVLRSDLVGRATELDALRAAWEQAARGEGSTLLVTGEPGIGKTRLLEELAAPVGDQGGVLVADSGSAGAKPFGLVAAALRPLILAMPEGAERSVAQSLLSDEPNATEIEVVLARALVAASHERPRLVLLGDLHLADRGSVDLLRFLTRATAGEAILWAATLRTGSPIVDALVSAGPWVREVHLDPLDTDAVAELFRGLLPGAFDDHDDTLRALSSRVAGNPEFAEEMAIALVDDGFVEALADRWRMTRPPDVEAVPATVSELIEARIDSLPDAARVTVQEAAAIGLRFSKDLLSRISSVPASVDASLSDLVSAELARPPAVFEDEPAYEFKSPLVRDVAYDTVLVANRPQLHRRVAEAVLDAHPGPESEVAELLAHHFDLARDVPRALHFLRLSVENAEAARTNKIAVDLATRALALVDAHPDAGDREARVWFVERRGVSHLLLNEVDEAASDLREATAGSADLGDTTKEAQLEERLGWYLYLAGEPSEGVAHLDRARKLADDRGLDTVRLAVEASDCWISASRGDVGAAVARSRDVVEQAAALGDPYTQAKASFVSGTLLSWWGDVGGAADVLDRGRALTVGRLLPMYDELIRMASMRVARERGDYRHALAAGEELLGHAEDGGDRLDLARVLTEVGDLHRELGDLDGAETRVEQGLEIAREISAPEVEVEALLALAELRLDLGEPDPASDQLAEARRRSRDARARIDAGAEPGWRLRARLALLETRLADTRGEARDRDAALETARTELGDARPARQAVRLACLAGDVEGATELAERAGSPALRAEAALAAVKTGAGDIGRLETAVAAMVDAAPDDLATCVVRSWPARELERLARSRRGEG